MKRGKERVETELLCWGQAIIVEELSKIQAFKGRIKELSKQFPEMASVEDFEYPLDIMIARGVLKKDDSSAIQRMEEYVNSLHELAGSYNLRCNWIIEGLHHIIRNAINPDIKIPIENWYARLEFDRLDIPVCPDTRKKEIQRVFNQEWRKMKSRHLELRMRYRIPKKFNEHVGWLCCRLLHNKPTGEIEPEKGIAFNYIDLKIRSTAKILGITLLRGRPRKSKNR